MDPEDLARKAMLGTAEVVAPAPALIIPAPPVPDVSPPAPEVVKKPWLTADKIKSVVQATYFRYLVLFLAVCILLLIISPPFVQVRRKNQSNLEKAPTSYKRVMVSATIITLIVALGPMLYNHKAKIVSTVNVVKKWF